MNSHVLPVQLHVAVVKFLRVIMSYFQVSCFFHFLLCVILGLCYFVSKLHEHDVQIIFSQCFCCPLRISIMNLHCFQNLPKLGSSFNKLLHLCNKFSIC